jgi:alkylhydroperoxidase family enzyme
MFLADVERNGIAAAGTAVPQILHLFAFRPEWTAHLAAFTQSVMRAPSPLTPAQREMIAAFTSSANDCHF